MSLSVVMDVQKSRTAFLSPAAGKLTKARILALALSFSLTVPVAAGPREDAATAYQRGDYGVAFRRWRPLAEQGDARAQAELGRMYNTGEGVAQDRVQAAYWFRKAADQGFANAQTHLGLMYQYAQGVPQDYVQALSWFRKAADQGEPGAQYSLGYMYQYAQGSTQDRAVRRLAQEATMPAPRDRLADVAL
jgi:uncharacterized protein